MILLQAQTSGTASLIMFGLIFLVMYFFMIRPQMKRQREAKDFRSAISKGDLVVTIGGLHGKIISISDLTVVLEFESGRVRVDKTAISPTGTPNAEEVQQK